jgi:hypothetical protein
MLIIALHFLSLRGGAVCGETVALFAVKWVALFGRNNQYVATRSKTISY